MSSLAIPLREIRARTLKPTPKVTVVECADAHRYLSPEAASTPGKWNTDVVEAARGPMLAVTEKGVKKITIMGPTQLMKTEFINNVVLYFMYEDPSPMVVMQPDEKLKDTWVADRLEPMIRDTPVLRDLVTSSTKDRKGFPGGHVTAIFAGSPSDVASRPVRLAIMDEIDKNKNSGQEGDAEKLLEQRLDTFWNSLSIAVCSPTLVGSSKIAARFEESDQRLFHGQCVHCDEYERLDWEQVDWDDNDASTARYICSHCKTPWSELDRIAATSKGRAKYIATKPFNGHAGFHANAIASPWQPLSKLVEKFLAAGTDPEKIKVFHNTSLALPYQPAMDIPDDERLYERRESYPVKIVPDRDIKFLTMGVDIQGDRIEYQVIGWRKDKQNYSIDYRVIEGQTHTEAPWKELTKDILELKYKVEGKAYEMPVTFTCIDSSYHSSIVQSYVLQFSPARVRAIRGKDELLRYYKMGSPITDNFDGSTNKFAHRIWLAGVSFMKTEFFTNLKLPIEDEDGNFPAGFCHFPEYDREFFKGICGEALKLKNGKYSWERHYRKNEPLDTWIYARTAASMFGLDRFKEQDWAALEGILEQAAEPKLMPGANPKSSNNSQPQSNPGLWRNPGLMRRR